MTLYQKNSRRILKDTRYEKLQLIPCSIMISITKERGTCFSNFMSFQKGMNEGLDTYN